MKPITVVLADDHTIVREGLRSLLQGESDVTIVGEAETGRQAVSLVRRLRPAVIVMDIAMPLLNGIDALRQIRAVTPRTRVLMLSAHGDDEYILRAIAGGAAGFLLKQTSALLLARALREIVAGRTFFCPTINKRLVDLRRRGVELQEPKAHLSSREQEVLQRVAEGAPNKHTAGELGISIKTVEKHRQELMDKLGIHDTAGLTRYAIAAGVIESSVQSTTRLHAGRSGRGGADRGRVFSGGNRKPMDLRGRAPERRVAAADRHRLIEALRRPRIAIL